MFTVLDAGNYKLLGQDLTRLNELEAALRMLGVDFRLPTLFFSEVATTYMPHRR